MGALPLPRGGQLSLLLLLFVCVHSRALLSRPALQTLPPLPPAFDEVYGKQMLYMVRTPPLSSPIRVVLS